MTDNIINEIYQSSNNKYKDLYEYFLTHCGFSITSTRLNIGFDTYRIRDYQDISEINNKDDVKYPPFSRSFSRIGKPNQIWFYISDDYQASFAEMLPIWYKKVNAGTNIKIVLSIWHIRQEIKVLIIPDLKNINEVCKRLDLSTYLNEKDFWSYICERFGTSTLDDENIYLFTSAFANALMDRAKKEGKEFDGIFYPSVQYPFKSNIALLPSCVDYEKVILRSLLKGEFKKSYILNIHGTPNYEQISDFEQGFYDPDKDVISWTK